MANNGSPYLINKTWLDALPGSDNDAPRAKNRGHVSSFWHWCCFWRWWKSPKPKGPWVFAGDVPRSPDTSSTPEEPPAPTPKPEPNREPEERRATNNGPQLCSLVVDHSGSMEQGNKAAEATRVLREVIRHAQTVNTTDPTGRKVYFYTQIVLFAERLEDSTKGMSRPPDELSPEEAYTIRHPASRERLGNLTNFQAPLAHVYKTLTGKQGMTKARLDAGMPAPIVLFITDGKANLPEPEDTARKLAMQEADRLKALTLPTVQCFHPVREQITYGQANVRLITIGLGDGPDLDQDLLKQLCTHVHYRGEDLPLYLHCPKAEDLHKIGARIVGTVTTAGQITETLEEAIYALRHSTGTEG